MSCSSCPECPVFQFLWKRNHELLLHNSKMTELETQVKRQQELIRTLRTFVDALRAIKKEEQADEAIAAAVQALCSSVPDTRDAVQEQPSVRERVWEAGLVPLLQQLGACMLRIDELEVHAAVLTSVCNTL